ncbi:crotonase/enoyl-CoA hydratase family protein [Nakamurella leprariae]|uniref:enoyl-CoA hydratase n=1 Tax=Nakamurella leprariae TaxID=2803911 RepID=A0A938YDH7_9ACTN|nr:crotonase/enoyl-CoA hydratase family protein [Nakamurella leprariae]MBM9466432.1 crotonase/enoyl-CoA hydratase family protein [Nakamurella leprariae]
MSEVLDPAEPGACNGSAHADGTVAVGGNGTVLAERRGHVLIVTLHRPEARNAVNTDLTVGVGEALDLAEADPSIWVVVITGAGDKAFCAGADLKEAARGRQGPVDPRMERWGFAGYVKHMISKPTIAAVNGFALGGGTEIVLASDLAVAADTATFGLPEVKRGIFAGAGGAFRLARQIPPKIAMEHLLAGDPLPAARAFELGLVNAVVPLPELLDTALALAERICVNAPLSVQASKRLARGIVDGVAVDEADDWDRTAEEGRTLMRSADAMEGMTAFAEKRAPRWQGR